MQDDGIRDDAKLLVVPQSTRIPLVALRLLIPFSFAVPGICVSFLPVISPRFQAPLLHPPLTPRHCHAPLVFCVLPYLSLQLPEASADTQRPSPHHHTAGLLWAHSPLPDEPSGLRGESGGATSSVVSVGFDVLMLLCSLRMPRRKLDI